VGLNIARFEQRSGYHEKTVPGDRVRREGGFATADAKPAQNAKLAVIEFKDVEYVAHRRQSRKPGDNPQRAMEPKVPVCRTKQAFLASAPHEFAASYVKFKRAQRLRVLRPGPVWSLAAG
jgi:hypothetical protein